jgi:hypothetical protein
MWENNLEQLGINDDLAGDRRGHNHKSLAYITENE